MFNFITDEAFTTAINSIGVNVAHGKVRATNPFGQLSDNILVVNTCSTGQSFDLKISLDSSFDTQPHGNPGNAVFTYFMTGFVDPSTFNISAFTSGTAQGERLCLANITLPAGQTFLTTVHMGIVKGLLPSQLPSDWSFDYSAEARAAGSGCLGALNALVTPNPAPASLSFNLN
jgi:hypothetical protein